MMEYILINAQNGSEISIESVYILLASMNTPRLVGIFGRYFHLHDVTHKNFRSIKELDFSD